MKVANQLENCSDCACLTGLVTFTFIWKIKCAYFHLAVWRKPYRIAGLTGIVNRLEWNMIEHIKVWLSPLSAGGRSCVAVCWFTFLFGVVVFKEVRKVEAEVKGSVTAAALEQLPSLSPARPSCWMNFSLTSNVFYDLKGWPALISDSSFKCVNDNSWTSVSLPFLPGLPIHCVYDVRFSHPRQALLHPGPYEW